MVIGRPAEPLKPLCWKEPIQNWHTPYFTSPHQVLHIISSQSYSHPRGWGTTLLHTEPHTAVPLVMEQYFIFLMLMPGNMFFLLWQVPWLACVQLHERSHFSHSMGKAGVWRSRLKLFFFLPSIRLKVGIDLRKYQGCKTDHRSQRDTCPQATSVVGKVEKQRT